MSEDRDRNRPSLEPPSLFGRKRRKAPPTPVEPVEPVEPIERIDGIDRIDGGGGFDAINRFDRFDRIVGGRRCLPALAPEERRGLERRRVPLAILGHGRSLSDARPLLRLPIRP